MHPLCPNCFSARTDPNYCRYCGYKFSEAEQNNSVLQPMTVLQEKYIVGRTLGIGGFGITYLAYDLSAKQKVAIKEYFPAELAVTDDFGNVIANAAENESVFEHCKEGFINEAKILYQLHNDKTIVKVLDYFDEKQTAFLVMEFLDGCTMKEKMRHSNGKVSVAEATNMLLSVGSALMAVHEKGILHRDVSPENIFWTKSGEYKLIDFGASRYYTSRQNKSLSVVLKPGFAPPEQYSSHGNQGPWTDVYSLAATYYCLVSGVKMVDAMDRLSGVEMKPLHTICPEISIKTSRAVEKALTLNYKNRYQTILEFLNDIDYSSVLGDSIPQSRFNSDYDSSVPTNANSPADETTGKGTKGIPTIQCEVDGKLLFSACFTQEHTQIKVGRGSTSDLVIPNDFNISRTHCIAEYDFGCRRCTIMDVSTNGTFFNDSHARLEPNKVYVLPEDTCVYLVDPAIKLTFLYMK